MQKPPDLFLSSVICVVESNKVCSANEIEKKISPRNLITNVTGKLKELGNLATDMEIILKWIEDISDMIEVTGNTCIGTGSSDEGGE